MTSVLVALRRLRDDRVPAIGLALLVLVTATVAGLAPRILERVGDDALHGVVAAADPVQRDVTLFEEEAIPADPGDPLKLVQEEGDRLDEPIPDSIAGLIASRSTVVDSARFQVRADTNDPTFVRFRIQPGAETRIRYVAGVEPTVTTDQVALPEALRRFTPFADDASGTPVMVPVIGAAISSESAKTLGASLGSTWFLSLDSRDSLVGRSTGVVQMRVDGIYDVTDEHDPFWSNDQTVNHVGIRTLGGDTRLLDIGALLPAATYGEVVDASNALNVPVRYAWRHFVDAARLSAASLPATIQDARRLESTYPQAQTGTGVLNGVAMRSGLLGLLVAHAARWSAATAILTVVVLGPAAVAIAALALVAMLAARRRRPALALVRGRGATLGQVTRAVLVEGLVIVAPMVVLGLVLAIALLPGADALPTVLAAVAVGVVAIGLLVLTALTGGAATVTPARDADDVPRGPSIRRLVFDGVVIVLAIVAAWLLRERGIRGTSSAGTLAAADPLVAAVPVLVGVAVGLILVRLTPIPLRVLGRIAARGRGLVPVLAMRHAAQGGTTTAVLIVLLLAASIGAFSTATLVHMDRAGAASSWQEIGAPFRITSFGGPLPLTMNVAKMPGVRSSALLFERSVPMGDLGTRVNLVAVDLPAYEQITAGTPGDLELPTEMLVDRPAGDVIPILVPQSLADRPDGVPVGSTFPVAIDGYRYQMQVVGTRPSFPTVDPGSAFAIASRSQLKAVHPEPLLGPTVAFVDAAESDEPALRAAVAAATPVGIVESRLQFEGAFTDSPVTAAIQAGILVAAAIAGLYAAVAVAAALALSGASRASEVARLRTMGLSRRDGLGLSVLEHGPIVLIAGLGGIALGLGIFVLVEPGLGLDGLIGAAVEVPFSVDARQMAAILGLVLAVAVVGVLLATWAGRRGAPIRALREGAD
ncbi:MAG TPA: FtsX-like permease family protein [Candidatus Limnocylindrales bacterium]